MNPSEREAIIAAIPQGAQNMAPIGYQCQVCTFEIVGQEAALIEHQQKVHSGARDLFLATLYHWRDSRNGKRVYGRVSTGPQWQGRISGVRVVLREVGLIPFDAAESVTP